MTIDVDHLIEAVMEREGGYVRHSDTAGGPTCFGINEAVARAHGFDGPMRQFPRVDAAQIYARLYWLRPRFYEIHNRSPAIAAELFELGVNIGPAVAATFLQRALTALNHNGGDYPDLVPDGRIGDRTLAAFDCFLKLRGTSSGETVLLRALEALQGERYLRLAERRPANETFLYSWLANRPGEAGA
jgi:lysozyme family protein